MRILYLAFADLGVPRAWTVHVLSICRHLRALGHEVTLVTPAPSAEPRPESFGWVRVPLRWGRVRTLARFQAAIWRWLPRWIRALRIEAVYERVVPYAPWIPERAHAAGAAIAAEVNGILEDELAAEGHSAARAVFYRWTERLHLEACDCVVAVAPAIGERIRALCPRTRRVEVIQNGVDPDRFDRVPREEARRALGLPDEPWVGFVGTFYRSRALATLVRAMRRVRSEVPQARLLLVGDGPDRPAIEEAARLADGDAVRFAGEIAPEAVPTAIAAMNVCVFLCTLPRAETAVKIYEYMAGRRPIVASRTAGVGDWMEREGTGVGADATSEESVARAILDVLRSPAAASAMGDRGRALVEERHTWRRSAERLAEVLERVVARWRQRGRRD